MDSSIPPARPLGGPLLIRIQVRSWQYVHWPVPRTLAHRLTKFLLGDTDQVIARRVRFQTMSLKTWSMSVRGVYVYGQVPR